MLHGRAQECAAIDAVLSAARDSTSRCLVLRGEPGIGKTALLAYAAAQASDLRVLSASGVPSESGLPFAGLHLLLRPALDSLDGIPAVQADALRAALGLARADRPDRFLVALAVLSLLSDLADQQPVLCLVDDAQWMDPESLDALLFVVRRLDAEGIAVLVATTERSGSTAALPGLTVVGLDRPASDTLMIERTGTTPAPAVRALLWEATKGNPLALSEMSAGLDPDQLAGRAPIEEDLRLGSALQHALAQRAGRLPAPTRTLLLVAAAEASGDLGLVLRAGNRLGVDVTALEPAEAADLIEVDGSRLAFRQPLMRSAVYHSAPFGLRQAVHRALADSLPDAADADRRVWHRSVVAVGPDDATAADLASSARRARQRGGHIAAATVLERAADLTSDQKLAVHRLIDAAGEAWTAGRGDRVRRLLDRAAPMITEPVDQADAAYLRGLAESAWGDRRAAFHALLAEAEPVIPLDHVRAVRMLVEAGRVAWQDADLAGVVDVGRRLATVERWREAPERFTAEVIVALSHLYRGDAATAVPMLRATAAAADRDDPQQLQVAAVAAMFTGDDRTARDLSTRAVARGRALGAVVTLPLSLGTLATLDAWQGRFTSAAAHAGEGISLAGETGQDHWAAQLRALTAWMAAVQGRTAECATLAAEAIDVAMARRARQPVAIATWAMALADLAAGRWSEAITRLESLAAPHSPQYHPMIGLLSAPDLVECACRLDLPGLAREHLSIMEGFVRPSASAWTLALLARCRALLAEGPEAADHFEEALRRHAEGERRFDEARTHLLYGEHLRRLRRRADARQHLRTAIEMFQQLGAAPWEQRAAVELRATGETARRREPGTLTQLTPQQVQIIRLVAGGASNKDVAAQLFLSPRTVDYHLRNVFAKLGITSRAELARIPDLAEAA